MEPVLLLILDIPFNSPTYFKEPVSNFMSVLFKIVFLIFKSAPFPCI